MCGKLTKILENIATVIGKVKKVAQNINWMTSTLYIFSYAYCCLNVKL